MRLAGLALVLAVTAAPTVALADGFPGKCGCQQPGRVANGLGGLAALAIAAGAVIAIKRGRR